jgi:hypothetical protein
MCIYICIVPTYIRKRLLCNWATTALFLPPVKEFESSCWEFIATLYRVLLLFASSCRVPSVLTGQSISRVAHINTARNERTGEKSFRGKKRCTKMELIRLFLYVHILKLQILLSFLFFTQITKCLGPSGNLVGWGTMLQVRRSLDRLPMSLEFLLDLILPATLWPWSRLSL